MGRRLTSAVLAGLLLFPFAGCGPRAVTIKVKTSNAEDVTLVSRQENRNIATIVTER